MVRNTVLVVALLAAPASAQNVDSAIHLMCVGQALKDETVGGTLDLMAGKARTERVASEESVLFRIDGDNTGSARLPPRLQSPYREPNGDGTFRLIEVSRSSEEIAGRVRLHANYKMKFRLDRLTGVATLNGVLGDFSGRCEPYDPATVQRKF